MVFKIIEVMCVKLIIVTHTPADVKIHATKQQSTTIA